MASWIWLAVQVSCWFCAAVVGVLWWLWATRPHTNAPGPPTLPLIGNILDVRPLPVTQRRLRDFHQKYGDLVRFYMGPTVMMLVAHPDDFQKILLTDKLVDHDSYAAGTLGMFLGDGLISANGSRWKTHRKLINPTFHPQLLESFLEVFHEGALYLSDRLGRTQGDVTDVYPIAQLAALRNICKAAFGLDPDLVVTDDLTESTIASVVHTSLLLFQKMMVYPWYRLVYLLRMSAVARTVWQYHEVLKEGAMLAITMRSQQVGCDPPNTRPCLVKALVKPGGETVLPALEIRDEMMNIAIAGTETTGGTINYVLSLLALHPAWQEAVRKELREVFGEGDAKDWVISLADLAKLRVLESVIKETLRLFPPVPFQPWVAAEDMSLGGGRVLVPKGTVLMCALFIMHRLPQFFPEPLRFDPGRFLDSSGDLPHPCCYAPFGLGARNCVGGQYARLQLKVFLAVALRRYRFLPHSSWSDLDNVMLSISAHPLQLLRVSCVPLDQ